MEKGILRVLALALVFAMLIPSASMVSNERSGNEVFVASVIFPSSSPSDLDYADYVERVIVPYEGFIMAELNQKQLSRLLASGATVIIEENLHTIGIEGYAFDTRFGEPVIRKELRQEPRFGVESNYLVQFVGPVKSEWLETLARLGAETLSYYPYYAVLVKATPELKPFLEEQNFVQWVGDYHPAYKIRPALMELNGGEEREVKIVTYKPEGVRTVLSAIYEEDLISGYEGKDFGLVKARLTLDEIETIAAMSEVSYMEPIYEIEALNERAQWIIQTNLTGNRRIWNMGINGSTQIVAISDTGIDYDHNFFRESSSTIYTGDLFNVTDTNRRKLIRYQPMAEWYDARGIDADGDGKPEMEEDFDGDGILEALSDSSQFGGFTGHGTTTSGALAGNDTGIGVSLNDGMAIGAKIYFQDVAGKGIRTDTGLPDDLFYWIPDDYYWLYIDPYINGSRIHSNSWGATNNEYDIEALMIDKFMWEYQDFLVIYPTGNAGITGPGSPSTAKSIVSAGWGNTAPNQNSVNGGSSKGPTADGRRSPTMIAPGVVTTSSSTGNPLDNANTDLATTVQGGSYASQILGGVAALVRDYYQQGFYPNGVRLAGNALDPSAALVKATMMASCKMMTGQSADQKNELVYPNNSQGWGRPLLDDVMYFAGDSKKMLVVDNKGGLNTGQVVEYEFNVTSATENLKFMLAWNDYPAALGSMPNIVNDLDLEVEAPNGTTFKGNRFSTYPVSPLAWYYRGYSIKGGAFDKINTDEGVIITTGNAYVDNWVVPGTWKARVRAFNVPVGPQSFGLVVNGDLNLDYGIVTIDKKVYGESDTINIEVRDSNAGAVTVYATSTSETTPEIIALNEVVAGAGIWRGSIDVDFGIPAADGKLQVKEGDDITVCYDDASPVHTSCATAIVDSAGPVITNVGVKDITNAVATVIWDTDEPSTSKVYYGETPSLERTPVEFKYLMVNHEVQLIGLKTDTIYYYDVESTDPFGHMTRDSNGGSHYTFRTTEAAEILVVYGRSIGTEDEPFDKHDHYRNALDANGWSYNEWYADAFGDPPLSLLQEYKVVMWQVGMEQYPGPSDTQQTLITSYLDGGGRFFLSSHDTAWGLCDLQNSQFSTPERCNWFNSTMKVRWKEDLTFEGLTSIRGYAGNPISGGYSTAPYPQYQAYRQGALGDEVECIGADGICTYTWESTQDIVNPASGPIAIQWTSASPNGTPGVGIWGGKVSKIVAYFFEFVQIEPTIPDSAIRADILDKTIRWLLDRDHPDVWVSDPDGGETFTTSPITITWTASAIGTNIDSQTLYYSDNGGQSWQYLDAVIGTQRIYNWDITSIPNGNRYMVKVKAQDNGDPPLIGSDESNATFTIMRPGGDNQGPITVPGSVTAFPNYVDSANPMWLNATIDDTNKGNSPIAAAEYFMQCTEPDEADYGTGTAMSASDGTFNAPVEAVTWTGTLGLTSGWYTFWVHGRDLAGNWGSFESERFLVLDGINPPDLTSPAEPTNVRIVFESPGVDDLRISWDASVDDDGDPANVEYYDIFFSTAYAVGGSGYELLTSISAVGAGSYYLIHIGGGASDPNNYFYYASARDQSCNYGINGTQVVKYNRQLTTGKNLVSIPVLMEDESVTTVLQTAAFDVAWSYDASDPADPWKTYNPSKTYNDLATINHTMALWVTTSADTNIVVVGKVPTNVTIQLQQGWNFVGYPSFLMRSIGEAMSGIPDERIEGYDANSLENLKICIDFDDFMPGYGYWIKVSGSSSWTIKE